MGGQRAEENWVLACMAGLGVVLFAALFVLNARSFRRAIADMVESETRVTVVNADGSVFYDTEAAVDSHAAREEVRKAFAEGRSVSLRRSETVGADLLYCARRVGDRVVRLAVPYTGVLKSERLAAGGLLAALLLGGCLVLLVYLFTRRLTRRLDAQAQQLEIATANETFRREFTSNVTHELKSPLTAILGAVEMLGDGTALADDERKELFDIIRSESGRLGSLVGDVLSLAQIEREQAENAADFARVNLADVVSAVLTREVPKAHAAHVKLDCARNDNVVVRGDAPRLEDALANLIENALRYSGSDVIRVTSAAAGAHVTVSVTDFGIGIPAVHLPHLFERFYRINKSRSRALGGTGLGLAIVKHIVQLHGGDVAVTSVPGRQTTFSFTLPLPHNTTVPSELASTKGH